MPHRARDSSETHRKYTPALVRLEQRLARDPCAILSATEVRLLNGAVRRTLLASFPGIEPYLTRSEDMTRWQALYVILQMNRRIERLSLPEGYHLEVFNAVQPFDTSRHAMKWDGEWH